MVNGIWIAVGVLETLIRWVCQPLRSAVDPLLQVLSREMRKEPLAGRVATLDRVTGMKAPLPFSEIVLNREPKAMLPKLPVTTPPL